MRTAMIASPHVWYNVPEVRTDYFLWLAHLLDWWDYRAMVEEAGGFSILDNGAAEGQRVPDRVLIEQAYKIAAHEVVVPDMLGDSIATVNSSQEFSTLAKKHRGFNYMGVVQGATLDDLLWCAKHFYNQDWISTIALPRVINYTLGATGRFKVAVELIDHGLTGKPIHFLGMGHWMREVAILNEIPDARGVDTSAPVGLGLRNRNLESVGMIHGTDVKRPDMFWQRVPTVHTTSVIKNNVKRFQELANV